MGSLPHFTEEKMEADGTCPGSYSESRADTELKLEFLLSLSLSLKFIFQLQLTYSVILVSGI